MKLYVAAILVAALGIVAPSAASAQTPAGYRAQLNGLCRGYTPKFRADQKAMQTAAKTKDWKAFGFALGHYLGLALAQDKQIERTPVPAPMRTQMTPILRVLRTADSYARLALSKAATGDTRGMIAELDQISKLTRSLNGRLDRAGIRDCGSNQS
jgi:hypothetical protein